MGGDKTIGPLLFNASVDGLTSTVFHQKCDGQGPTLTVVKSKEYNRVFGGFTTLDWSTAGQNYKDDSAFLFSLDDLTVYPVK